jgi:hypothetical protein
MILKKTIRCGSGGDISTEISGGASTLQVLKKAFHRYKIGNESVSHHLFTNQHNHYLVLAITETVSSFKIGLALSMH